MSWACFEIAALWERWERVPPVLALGPGSSFLSSKFQSPFPLVTSFISLSLTSQPSIPPLPSLVVPHSALFPICSLFKRVGLGKGAVYSLSAVMIAFSISKRAQQGRTLQFVVAVLSVSYWAGSNGACFQGLLAQPPLGRFSHRWKKHVEM